MYGAVTAMLRSVGVRNAPSVFLFAGHITQTVVPRLVGAGPVLVVPTEFQVVLLSVVFNRGVALGRDPDWRTAKALDTRWEMRKLQGDVARGDLFAIYIRLGTMKRIWENDPEQRGLPIRRKDEQHLVRPYVDKVLQWEQRRDDLKAAGLPPCSKASAEE